MSASAAATMLPPDGDLDANYDGRLEVEVHGVWRVPLWARSFGGPLPWATLMARLDYARRIWPGRRFRIVAATE